MADSVDRVFVHALNTVKKIPKTGAARPPSSDRLRLYGLYKQAMEGDVDGVMDRPSAKSSIPSEDLQREQDKWDVWNIQKGLSRTEAKRRYIEALIETMHNYATTPDALELVGELEFVWNQIKNNSPSSSNTSPRAEQYARGFSGAPPKYEVAGVSAEEGGGPLRVLNPVSEDDEVEHDYRRQLGDNGEDADDDIGDGAYVRKGGKWSKKMERAIVKLSAEIAALREQITTGREWRAKRDRSAAAWLKWAFWTFTQHLAIDVLLLLLLLLWMRRRKDKRLEDHVRAALIVVREYARRILPSR